MGSGECVGADQPDSEALRSSRPGLWATVFGAVSIGLGIVAAWLTIVIPFFSEFAVVLAIVGLLAAVWQLRRPGRLLHGGASRFLVWGGCVLNGLALLYATYWTIFLWNHFSY